MRQLVVATFIGLIGLGAGVAGQVQRFAGPTELPFSAATKADGLVYVAGMIAADGDIAAQTKARARRDRRRHCETAGLEPRQRGLGARVPQACVEDFAAMNEVYQHVLESRSAGADARSSGRSRRTETALVEISAVAVPNGGERHGDSPRGHGRQSLNPYSYGIKTGNTLFLAGLVARNGKDNSPGRRSDMPVANQGRAGQRRRDSQGCRHGLRARRQLARVHHRRHDVSGDERGLPVPTSPRTLRSRATVVARPMNAANVVEITMTAVNAPKQVFTTPAADATPGKPNPLLSSAVKVENRLYVSGILGNTPENRRRRRSADQGTSRTRRRAH